MTAHDRTNIWLTGIALIGLAASIGAGRLLWIMLTRPIAVIHWAEKF
jgi:hypothetical protein